MPVPEDLPIAYQDYYTHGDPVKPVLVRIARHLYRFATDLLLSIAGIPAERKRARLMFMGDRPPAALLDVGCGHGTFLAAMAERGWQVAGVDFDPAAVEAARSVHGLDVLVGTVDTMVERGTSFDVVTASHVVEHVPDPVEFLAQCRRLLRPGGRVVLKTPNADSFGSRRYGRAWRGLEPPRHLHIFTIAALESCARKAGFAGSRCFTSSAGADVILVASRFLAAKGSYRPHELSRLDAVQSRILGPLLALRAKFAWLLDKNSGEEICAVLTNDPSEPTK
jgi:SAM-dependent methyltransferase